jgi:hypothetical protein
MSELHADTAVMQSGSASGAGPKTRLLTLKDLDGRTRASRMAKDIFETLVRERGGADQMNAAQLEAAETYAVLTAMVKSGLTGWLDGQQIDATEIATILNARRREAQAMGGPEPRDVTPSIHAFAAEYAASKAAAESHSSNHEGQTL